MLNTTEFESILIAPKDADRLGQRRYGPGGADYRIVVTPGQTDGQHFALDAFEPPGGGPPLHTHANEDELFFVTEGEITFWVDGSVIRARAGQSAFVPRGVPHCFKNCSTRPARLFALFTPGHIERFFDFGLPGADGSRPSEAQLVQRIIELGPKFGLEVLGPSPL